jgi:transcriptional regulator with XRE-family HTH domain
MSTRSQQKIITKEARILKWMREDAKLSMRDAAERSGYSIASINFIENGRQSLLDRHLKVLLPVYKRTQTDFEKLLKEDQIPTSKEKEMCLRLIQDLPEELVPSLVKLLERICKHSNNF